MKANICKQWTKVITIIHTAIWSCTYELSSNEVLLDLFELYDLYVKGQGPMKVIMVHDTPPYGHAPTYQISLTYLKRKKCYGPDKKILFKKQLTLRSRSHEGHYSMRQTTLWSCTHIPNIIDLSRKTKMLWPGQENTI